jgi:hypothetical protein
MVVSLLLWPLSDHVIVLLPFAGDSWWLVTFFCIAKSKVTQDNEVAVKVSLRRNMMPPPSPDLSALLGGGRSEMLKLIVHRFISDCMQNHYN